MGFSTRAAVIIWQLPLDWNAYALQSPSERPSSGRMRLGDARLLERVQALEAELSEMDACADELEAEAEALAGENQSLESSVQQLKVLFFAQTSAVLPS